MTQSGSLLGVIDPVALAGLSERGHRRAHRAGEVLMRQGDPSLTVCLITNGIVRVERSVPALAMPLHLADLGPGELVGEIGVLNVTTRSATVTAITDVTLVELSREETLRALAELPGLPDVLRRLIKVRLRENAILEERLERYVRRAS